MPKFQPGQSGNPGGRPKIVLPNGKTLRDLAREHTEDCINALIRIVKTSDNDTAVRGAATDLLDRGWGKPTQLVAGDPEGAPIATVAIDTANAPVEVLRWIAGRDAEDATTH